MVKYLKTNKDKNFIKVEVYYSLGGWNYFTYEVKPRGYYICVQPVEKDKGFESFTAFTGYNHLVKEVSRKSKKAYEEAVELAKDYEDAMVFKVLDEQNLELVKGEQTC